MNTLKEILAATFIALALTSHAYSDEKQPVVNEKQEKGMKLVSELLAGTNAGGLPLPDTFGRYTIEHLFGDVWQGDELSLQDRSFTTCVALIALNLESEQRLHFVGAKNVGVPREKLEAAITQVAHYAGWPVAITAFRVLNDVWPKSEHKEKDE